MGPAFVGGTLSFKGEKKKKKKSKDKRYKLSSDVPNHALQGKDNDEKDVETEQQPPATGTVSSRVPYDDDDDMTEAEKKALKRRLERENLELAQVASKTHRERVEEFNEKLSTLTEHNDIPRVSLDGSLLFVFSLFFRPVSFTVVYRFIVSLIYIFFQHLVLPL
jgi:protein FAM32A